jgi:hypothetical protein
MILLFIHLISNTLLYSQKFDPKEILGDSVTLQSINIPLSFKKNENNTLERDCFDVYYEGKVVFVSNNGCMRILGYSFDKEFVVLMNGPYLVTVQDSIDFMKIRPIMDTICMIMHIERPMKTHPSPNICHRISVNIDLNCFLQREITHEVTREEFDKYVTFYPEEYARTKFNADSVATYNCWPFWHWYKEPYQGKYTRCQALMLQKKDKGYLTLYCFYTEESKKRINAFVKEIEGIVWFKD